MRDIEVRIYDDESEVPQPTGPVGLNVPETASDEQVEEEIRQQFTRPGRKLKVSPPSDPRFKSCLAADHGWRVTYV